MAKKHNTILLTSRISEAAGKSAPGTSAAWKRNMMGKGFQLSVVPKGPVIKPASKDDE